jgi:hypothetical protein
MRELLRGRCCHAVDVFEREAESGSKRADDQVERVSGSEVVLGVGGVLDAAPAAEHQAVAAVAIGASRAGLQDERAAA